jgi:hypothetical protein
LLYYVKAAQLGVIRRIQECINEYVRERSTGVEGCLAGKGLVPLTSTEAAKVRKAVTKK